MRPVIKKIFVFCLMASLFFLAIQPLAAPAASSNWTEAVIGRSLIPAQCRGTAKDCSLKDLIQVGINVFDLILGLLGSVSLAMFVYGGFIWILSRGNPSMIEKGKNIIFGTIIGISLVLCSWLIVNVILALVMGQTSFKSVTLFNSNTAATPKATSQSWSHFNP